ncbi:MAG: hypothetical protein J07HQW2_03268 [Haloquadratum walsbyi J07HQW2]|uniref:Uncharacterized protein n=1 Tax=Haloquadratum walsbyi J07HQW2 TaxID=1238425 RepID=U1N1P5_9EURY|nr:MAG: hypothetical protein J07HQW2_03268 [Haloquadratum walsbyi J07HQW2]
MISFCEARADYFIFYPALRVNNMVNHYKLYYLIDSYLQKRGINQITSESLTSMLTRTNIVK